MQLQNYKIYISNKTILLASYKDMFHYHGRHRQIAECMNLIGGVGERRGDAIGVILEAPKVELASGEDKRSPM